MISLWAGHSRQGKNTQQKSKALWVRAERLVPSLRVFAAQHRSWVRQEASGSPVRARGKALPGRVAAQRHWVEQDGQSTQQHRDEPMALGGIRSRSSSSGISSRR